MVVVRTPNRAAEEKPAIAAANIQNDRGRSTEESLPVERAVYRQPFERSSRPSGGIEDFTGDWYAEFALDPALMLAHGGILV